MSASPHTALLLLRCRRGDNDALTSMINQWERPLFFYIRRLLTSEADAWDALQKTWIRVIRNIHHVRDQNTLAPWLYTVARNVALSHRKTLLHEQANIDSEIPIDCLSADEPLPAIDVTLLLAALDKLATHHREPLTLFFLQDLTIEQIATVLDLPSGTVKSRLYYAKRSLRQILHASISENTL